jgi:hypothetical protein
VDEKKKRAGKEGGRRRAEMLTAEQRSEIARAGAAARYGVPTATHFGELSIGNLNLPCAVLPDGTRVISQGGVTTAFGPVSGGWQSRQRASDEDTGELPPFLIAKSLKTFISNELRTLVSAPRKYRDPRGGPIRIGFEATLLPKVCEVWLQARDARSLTKIQLPVAERADLLMRGLAHVGIIALVDEATGYQEYRDKQALQAILDAFLRKELAAWAKRFPDEFYEHIFRLRGWKWKGRSTNPPQVVAAYTKDIVYARLAPHILEELERRNPIEDGKRKGAHHQWLTEDVGHPALAQHLHAIITLMRVSKSWDQFKLMLDIAHPKRGDTLQLPLMADFETDPIKPKRLPDGQRSLFDNDEAAN